LLEEERVPAGAVDEDVRDLLGKVRFGDRERGVPVQWTELELAVTVREALPRELPELPRPVFALAAVEQDKPDGFLVHEREQLLEQLERRLVRPVQVLQQDAERALTRKCGEKVVDGLDRLALDAVARELAELLREIRLERNPEER